MLFHKLNRLLFKISDTIEAMSRRFRTHTNPFLYDIEMEPIQPALIFDNPTYPLDVEIGSGKGVFLQYYAKKYPQRNILAFEIRKQVVDYLNEICERENLSNVKVIHGAGKNGLEALQAGVKIEKVFIFHPDPWFKKRHHKRRVMNENLLHLLYRKLNDSGEIYFSTDVAELMESVDDLMQGFQSQFSYFKSDFWHTDYQSHWSNFVTAEAKETYSKAYKKIDLPL